jgi:plasmid stability protein
MPNISVKNVPDELVEKLRRRAKRNHRSLQGEMMSILEEATGRLGASLEEADARLQAMEFITDDDSSRWIRELRNAR